MNEYGKAQDIDLFTMIAKAFGLDYQRFQAAWDFDICIAFRDSEGELRWMFYFDPETGSLLQVQQN